MRSWGWPWRPRRRRRPQRRRGLGGARRRLRDRGRGARGPGRLTGPGSPRSCRDCTRPVRRGWSCPTGREDPAGDRRRWGRWTPACSRNSGSTPSAAVSGWLEVDLEALLDRCAAPQRLLMPPVSRFPSSDVDLAFVVDDGGARRGGGEDACAVPRASCSSRWTLFDVYRGVGHAAGRPQPGLPPPSVRAGPDLDRRGGRRGACRGASRRWSRPTAPGCAADRSCAGEPRRPREHLGRSRSVRLRAALRREVTSKPALRRRGPDAPRLGQRCGRRLRPARARVPQGAGLCVGLHRLPHRCR